MTPDWLLPALAGLSLVIWLYLVVLRGGFWRADQWLPRQPGELSAWPRVRVVIPARNEAEVVATTLASVLTQDYPGEVRVVLVDDNSSDGTAALADRIGAQLGQSERLTVVRADTPPSGWSGKLWALSEGLRAEVEGEPSDYIWFTDADIEHWPSNLRRLVAKAESERLDLVSLMARLSCSGFWERLLLPPFVFFFQKLYPFPWSNDPRRRTAAAAGGCALVKRRTFEAAGGLEPIKSALIDDCALGHLMKTAAGAEGRGTWVGLTQSARSIRPYAGLGGVWTMVARTAYTQLRFSPVLLVGTLFGMLVTYLVAPAILLATPWHGDLTASGLALATWALITLAAWPTYRLYEQPLWRTLLLPVAAFLYSAMTLDSALEQARGRGGTWKGRAQAQELA